ncbi:MAG: flavodoxin domain-containing protein [Saccharofermentanales bacterium]|jgi:menaquinone-dependent protoporphyrinogen IX oxidase
MKSLVLYRSQYGSTEQYARWIQEELSCQSDHIDNLSKYDISDYDLIIVGEGVYAGQLKAAKKLIPIIEEYPDKKYIFFMVGIADMEDQENRDKLYSDLAKAMGSAIEKMKVFFLRGVLDYSKLNFKHKTMMWMLVKYLKGKDEKDLPKDGDQLISTYGKKVSFIDRNSIEPLIKYAKEEF